MKNSKLKIKNADPEQAARFDELADERRWFLALLWLICVVVLALDWLTQRPARVWHWIKWQHVCAWCTPKRRMGGNPWARRITHGMCPACAVKWTAGEFDHELATGNLSPSTSATSAAPTPAHLPGHPDWSDAAGS